MDPIFLLPSDECDSTGWSASKYNQVGYFSYSPVFTAPLLDLLAPQPGERIMDFGCGSGELTLRIADCVGESGKVVGVDASESMVSDCTPHPSFMRRGPSDSTERFKLLNPTVSSTHSSPMFKPSNSPPKQAPMKPRSTRCSLALAYRGANAIPVESWRACGGF
jgi:hypothetical protein